MSGREDGRIDGTAQGMMKMTLSQRIHTRSCTKKPERNQRQKEFEIYRYQQEYDRVDAVRKNTGPRTASGSSPGLRARPQART